MEGGEKKKTTTCRSSFANTTMTPSSHPASPTPERSKTSEANSAAAEFARRGRGNSPLLSSLEEEPEQQQEQQEQLAEVKGCSASNSFAAISYRLPHVSARIVSLL